VRLFSGGSNIVNRNDGGVIVGIIITFVVWDEALSVMIEYITDTNVRMVFNGSSVRE